MLDESIDTTNTSTTDTTDNSSSAAAHDGTAEVPATPRKRASRKAAEPAAKKTAKKAAAKRATKKTAASTEASDAGPAEASTQASTDGSTEGSTEASAAKAPAAKKTAKRASRSARKTAPQPDGNAREPSTASETRTETAALTQQPPAGPVGGIVLFQAPEPVAPTRSRSRRATSGAGPAAGDAQPVETGQGAAAEQPSGESDPESTATGDEAGEPGEGQRKRRRRGGRGRRGRSEGDSATDEPTEGTAGREASADAEGDTEGDEEQEEGAEGGESTSSRRRRRRRRSGQGDAAPGPDDPPNTVVRVRERRPRGDEITGVRGSTRLEAKKQRRREGREQGRRKQVITEAEFLARRESVERVMVVRQNGGRTQIGVLEDDILVEHYVSRDASASMAGNVYLGRVQNVLPSMEAAFVDIGKGRNAVLYAGEVNWDAAGLTGQAKRIENVLKSGESVLVQVTKDPLGHKGARLTSQISLPGRYLVYVPQGSMTGISRKLPENERNRLKQILKAVLPEGAGVIVRTAAEGASEEELRRDVERLTQQWEEIQAGATTASAPALLHGEPDLTVRVIRDVFNEDFAGLVVSGGDAWQTTSSYVAQVAPDLTERVTQWTAEEDVFSHYRIDEQLAKALDRKVWLPSGGSLVIDRTEAMTVVDVNTGKFTGSGGNLEETVTKNNIEAAEEIVRQLRLRDVGGIIVIDFIDMVLESNRELVLRRLLECLGRDRTKHQVAEVTSLGLVQMTRKRVGQGLLEVFSETCEVCHGRGVIVHTEPVEKKSPSEPSNGSGSSRGGRRGGRSAASEPAPVRTGPTAAEIAARAHAAALHNAKIEGAASEDAVVEDAPVEDTPVEDVVVEDAPVEDAAVDEAVVEAVVEEGLVEEAAEAAAEEAQRRYDDEAVPEPAPVQPPRRRRGRATAPAGPPPPHDT